MDEITYTGDPDPLAVAWRLYPHHEEPGGTVFYNPGPGEALVGPVAPGQTVTRAGEDFDTSFTIT